MKINTGKSLATFYYFLGEDEGKTEAIFDCGPEASYWEGQWTLSLEDQAVISWGQSTIHVLALFVTLWKEEKSHRTSAQDFFDDMHFQYFPRSFHISKEGKALSERIQVLRDEQKDLLDP